MNYFGTDLTSYGHYFWQLESNQLAYQKPDFGAFPFSPEKIVHSEAPKGTAVFCKLDGYSICAIAGSCKDARGGTKSVFWVEGSVEPGPLKEMILAIPIARKMIEQMPFTVKW